MSAGQQLGTRRLLLGFLGLNALAGLSIGIAKVILSLYAIELQADTLQLGLIAGAQSIGLLLVSLPAGVLVDQHGPLRLFSVGTLGSGALYLLLPWIDSATLLCLTMVLISAFMPLRIVALSAMFMQQIGRVGIGMAGWFRATHMLGMLLLGPLAGALLLAALGFTGSYLSIAALFFLLVLLAPGILRHYQRPEIHARRLSLAELKAQAALLRHDRLLRQTCLREFCMQAVNQFYTFFIVVIALQSFRFEAAAAAGLISAQGSSYILALLALGGMAARMPERRFFTGGCLLVCAALAVLGGTAAAWGLWGGAVTLGLGLGMLQIVNITRFARVGEREGQGRIAGLTTFVGPAGGLAGSLLGGVLGHGVGLQVTFLLLIPVFLAFALASRETSYAYSPNE